ncbi:TetR family transcriptional regulator [Nocardioides sp. Kera G14]|uniref:acyl-CoA-like ligand-binding transcription factor n=1 Tax=Nocardioides sp. Kera G14 TaxID=2884264 RepID=UPI001D12A5F3|nr:TetR family transcriptional regulator [Nocardioides sp. Kera G14]UDY24995.1 TetR family transcriptional regulator [Nocardioides sp. Kera G14]
MRLWLRDGYEAVSVDQIAAEMGISRSTVFRYFRTKAAIVWAGFDRALEQLSSSLAATAAEDTMAAIRAAVGQAVYAGTDDRGVWWERFVLFDSVPALRAEAADRWERWVTIVAAFVAGRMGVDSLHPYPMAIASAHQGVYIATLRTWEGRPGDPEQLLDRMTASMEAVGEALAGLLG